MNSARLRNATLKYLKVDNAINQGFIAEEEKENQWASEALETCTFFTITYFSLGLT
jgi:hypothetical protein